MKYIKFLAVAFMALALSAACEKPIIDDGDGKETSSTTKGNGNDKGNGNGKGNEGDNGGWQNDTGNGDKGTDWMDGDTVSVSEFRDVESGRAVWVKGYIVGCATGSGGYRYQIEPPFEFETAILLSDKTSEDNIDNVIAVQLKNGSHIRQDLNLVKNKGLYGKEVRIFGERTTYLKLPGIKTIFAYEYQ